MQKMPSYGVVLLFTDTSTKNHQLENEIIAYGKEKDIDVIVVFTPKYSGKVGDASWQVYQRVSQHRVFELKTFDFDQILGKVSQLVEKNCLAGMNLSASSFYHNQCFQQPGVTGQRRFYLLLCQISKYQMRQ